MAFHNAESSIYRAFEPGGKACGSRFVYLTGAGAMLELALINWAMTKAVSKGFKPMVRRCSFTTG